MAQKRKRKKVQQEAANIEMTPMIDVVFQLLVYFIVTMKPVDVAAHLDVFRPSMGAPPKEASEPPKMIRIQIYPEGVFLMNDTTVTLDRLTTILEKLAAYSKTQTVMIMCSRDSEHKDLIHVLDRCARVGMSNLSVISTD